MKKFGGKKILSLYIHFAPVYFKKKNTKKKEKNLIVKFFSYKEAIVYMLWLVMKK